MSQSPKPWGVMDRGGSGWGRFATRAEAEARRDELRAMRDSAANPTDATAQFDVVKVHP